MIKVEAPKFWLANIRNKVNPEQASMLSKVFLILGSCLIAKSFLDMWPSIPSVLIRTAIAIILVVYGVRELHLIQRRKWGIKWLISAFIGMACNWSVMIANGGYMPSIIKTEPWGIYIPLQDTKLSYLGDWIWRGMSPGDILIFIAFFGIIATMVANRRQKTVEGT